MAGYQPRHDTDPVWYNGQQVNTLTYASAQAGVLITAIHGWDERPDIRDVREDRAGDDGEWADNLFLGGRTITIEGEVMGSSWVNLQSRKRSLAAIFNPTSDEVLFKVPDPATVSPTTSYSTSGMTGYERVSARVIEAISFGDTLDPACQTFQVILRASDPRVYSDEVTTTSSGTSGTAARTVTVDQSGTYATPVDITVTGPTGATLTVSEPSSGLNLVTSGLTIGATETLAIASRNRSIQYTSTYEGIRTVRSSLIGLWMLDESAGTTADNEEGTSAIDGTYTGGYTLNQAGPFTGLASVELNGSTGYVSVPDHANFDVSDELTIEAWVRFDSISSSMTIVDKGGTSGFRLFWNGVDQFVINTGVTRTVNLVYGSLAASTWYHIVAHVDGPYGRLYVNGSLAFSGDNGGYVPSMNSASTMYIGSNSGVSSFFDGKIAAVAVYGGLEDAASLYQTEDSASSDAYQYLSASSATWAPLGTGSSTYTLSSSGLNTGSQLSVSYRNARL